MGFKTCIVPRANFKEAWTKGIEVYCAQSVDELLEKAL